MPKTVSPVIPAGRMAAMDQPVIEAGGGLRLRPWHVGDAQIVLTAYTDPAIRRFHLRSLESVEEAAAFIAGAPEAWQREKFANWAVVRGDGPDGGAVVGRVGLSYLDLEAGLAEISYWVLPDERGRGVSGAAVSALTDWSFDVLGVHRLEIMHASENLASCAVATRAGFEAEGTLRSYQLHEDGWHDMHLHSRIRPD